jgi:uncharacterized protein YbgA (DUF1722 family)/uncharacterized protein YbbK (DUF523 family)
MTKGKKQLEFRRVRLGISSCLLGENVRFDGGHKRDTLITDGLGAFFEWVPVCPEMELGLGTPRESLRLVGSADTPRLVAQKSLIDHSRAMRGYAARRVAEIEGLGLRGYILKKDSPSCGMERVRVYGRGGVPERRGRGLFAQALIGQLPLLPVEEEGRLHDMALRENFIERVFAYDRWLDFLESRPKPRDLVRFHARHKLTLMSHDRRQLTALGRLAARAGGLRMSALVDDYGKAFLDALRIKATRPKHANVLYHLLGFLKKAVESDDRAEKVERIEDYRRGLVPLIVPITLLAHHFRHHPHPWVAEQTYLNPYPAELMLRNHV